MIKIFYYVVNSYLPRATVAAVVVTAAMTTTVTYLISSDQAYLLFRLSLEKVTALFLSSEIIAIKASFTMATILKTDGVSHNP